MGEEVIEVESPVKGASILLKRNFKGEYGVEIRIQYDPEVETHKEIVEQLKGIDRMIKSEFING